MIDELDTVVLSHDLDEYGLKEGDIGAVVVADREHKSQEPRTSVFLGPD